MASTYSSSSWVPFLSPLSSPSSRGRFFFFLISPLFNFATSIPWRAFLSFLNSMRSASLENWEARLCYINENSWKGTNGRFASFSEGDSSSFSSDISLMRGWGRVLFLIIVARVTASLGVQVAYRSCLPYHMLLLSHFFILDTSIHK